MIASLWANSNYDDDRGSRQLAIQEIEEKFNEAILSIHGIISVEEEDIDKSNPFFAQMEKGMAKLQQPENPNSTVDKVIQEYDIDQYG